MLAIALLAGAVLASVIALTHRAGEYEANRRQVVAYLVLAKARAVMNGGAAGATGETLQVAYEPAPADLTTLSLYDGRPFGTVRTLTLSQQIAPLRVRGRLALGAGGDPQQSDAFAVFIGAAGTTAASAGYTVNRSPPIAEPTCPYDTGLSLAFASAASVHPIVLSCATGEIVPDASQGVR